ncbi:MAG TPA: hypothetical protein VGE07_05065, partial [Herpetosiphonaceae bacterium]
MSDPLFKDSDEIEATYGGDAGKGEQPTNPPIVFRPEREGSVMPTPPLRADEEGLRSEPLFHGAVGGDNATSAAPRLDP